MNNGKMLKKYIYEEIHNQLAYFQIIRRITFLMRCKTFIKNFAINFEKEGSIRLS